MSSGEILEMNFGPEITSPNQKGTLPNVPTEGVKSKEKPDSLAKAWLFRVWDSPFRWWLITPATVCVLIFAMWVTLLGEAKMQLWNFLKRAIIK